MSEVKEILSKYPKVKQMARKMISLVPLSRRLGKEFWDWYSFFDESESWSAAQFSEFQVDRLRILLAQLRQTSPFYRRLLDGININSITSMDEFRFRIPTMSRTEFRDNYRRILSTSWAKRGAVPSKTSGTTGTALQFYHGVRDGSREWAAICHQWKRVGYDPCRSRRVEFRGLTLSRRLVDVFPEQNKIRCSITHMKADHVRYYAEAIRKYDAEFYSGYPSAICLLAREVAESVRDFPQPKAVLLASETIYDWQLRQIRNAFPAAKVFAHYGCAERTVLGGWCEYRDEYHILPQYAFVEIDPVSSEVIGTNLYNNINGFLRYRMTDTAIQAKAAECDQCGRKYLPVLSTLCGRVEDYLYSPARGWIPPAILTYPLKGLKRIGETQLLQAEPGRLVIRYSVRRRGDEDYLADEIRHITVGFYELFGEHIDIDFERVESFPRTASGKFKWVVSELGGPGFSHLN